MVQQRNSIIVFREILRSSGGVTNFLNLLNIRSYNKVLILNPKKDNAWHNKGVALNDLGKY